MWTGPVITAAPSDRALGCGLARRSPAGLRVRSGERASASQRDVAGVAIDDDHRRRVEELGRSWN